MPIDGKRVSSQIVGKRKVVLSAAALALVALSASACATASAQTAKTAAVRASGAGVSSATPTAEASTTSAPAVTAAEAHEVFSTYVTTMARALAAPDQLAPANQKAALSLTLDVQWHELSTAFLTARYDHTTLSPYQYGTPKFYLPAQNRYPQWFVASVRRTAAAPTTLAGVPLAAGGQVLMLFEKLAPQRQWLLTSSLQFPAGQSMPKLATNSGGYVATVPLDSPATLARPDVTGPLQAAVVDDGPTSAAAKVVTSGPLTTGLYAAQATSSPVDSAPRGDVRQWELEGSKYDRFALRTANGDALVFYSMYLNTTIEVPAELAESSPVPPGPPISIPPEYLPLLGPHTAAPRKRLITQDMLAFAAIDPLSSATNPKIQVIAMGGTPSWASAS